MIKMIQNVQHKDQTPKFVLVFSFKFETSPLVPVGWTYNYF